MNNKEKHPRASVIIVSHNRPDKLRRVLLSLQFQTYPNFEVIIVTNSSASTFLPTYISSSELKIILYNKANISAARNLGINAANSEFIIFCDDDAIPETQWLLRLIKAFDNPRVAIAGGFVRGRNGISFQWQGLEIDHTACEYHLDMKHEPFTRAIHNNRILKVQGTNAAFRKSAVCAIGGFDETITYYLDETDISWRLSKAGWHTTIVPLAEVQHGYAANAMRNKNRAPLDIFELGRSLRIFLSKHANPHEFETAYKRLHAEQHKRLTKHLIWGHLEPCNIRYLMKRLREGFDTPITASKYTKFTSPSKFIQYPRKTKEPILAYANFMRMKYLKRYCEKLAIQGHPVTAFCFSRTTKFHNRFFTDAGFWMQRGGIYGKSDRKLGYLSLRTFNMSRRTKIERESLKLQRNFKDENIHKITFW